MEYRIRDRDRSPRRRHHTPHHRHVWDGDHADHHDFHNWAVKKVRFRSHSSPPPPLASLRYGIQSFSLEDDGRVLDQDDEYSTWEKPVVFAPEEASYRPRKWLEKLEKLEAQIVTGSARPGPALHEPIHNSHSLQVQREELHRLRPVLIGVRENLRTLQQAHYCSRSINMLVLEKSRKEVVRLVDLTITVIQKFIGKAIQFIDHDDIVSLSTTETMLRYCADILAWMELRPRVLHQFRVDEMGDDGSVRSSEHYEHDWRRGHISSALTHALRVAAYTLDIAVVSFAGAHLEPFDEVYFGNDHDHHHHHDRRREYYNIPCDEHAKSSILIYPRHFDCLSGFLGNNPAWVFEAHERGQTLDLARLLYLRTSPEQLANVWGPVWRAETVERGGASRFMLSKGFLIGWHHSSAVDPPLYEGEYLCHWTDDPSLLSSKSDHSSAGLPRYININYLLIGAHPCETTSLTFPPPSYMYPALEVNKHCSTTSTEIYHQLQQHHEMTNLGTHFAEWYLAPSYIPISVDPPGGYLGYGTDLVFKRRQGTSCREAVCSKLVAQPWKYLGLLGDLYGISISGCTGNARRVRLLDVVLSPTMREFASSQLPWVLDHDRWNHFRDILLWHSSSSSDASSAGPPDYVHIAKHATETQRYDYARYLKLAIGSIKHLPITSASDHIDALYAYHGSGYRVRISPGVKECGWLGLLNDSLTSFSAPVVEVSCCLECRPGGIFCHHYHHHHFHRHNHSRYSPRDSSCTIDEDDEKYYLAPPKRSDNSNRSPSVTSTISVGSSRRSSCSVASPCPRRSSSSHMSHISTSGSHASGHASHGYGTVLETTILVNPHAPSPLISISSTWPSSHRCNTKGKHREDRCHLHDWNYMEYMDWNREDHHSRHSTASVSASEMSEASRIMVKAYPKGTIIDLGDAGELYVLGHLLATRTIDHSHSHNHRHEGYGYNASRSRSRSRNSEEDGQVILIVERRRPKERNPRTIRYFLEKVNDADVPREFHHGELVRWNDISSCGYIGCGHVYSCTAHDDKDDDYDDDELVIIEEHSDVGRSRERIREKDRVIEVEEDGGEGERRFEVKIKTDKERIGSSTYTGTTHRVYPGLRPRCLERLLHVLVVSDVHDGLISEWVRELEVE